MKILNFFIAAGAINAQQVDNDVNVASLAENLDKIKFELNEILLSRENERDHLEARIIDLENKLQQVQTISTAIAEGTDGELDIDQIDPSLIARKEEKAEVSYHERLMAILSN